MFLTIFSIDSMGTWSSDAVLGYGLLVGLMVAIALSSQRWLLWYLFGGMGYWLAVEIIQSVLLNWVVLSEWHSYVTAIGISWLPLCGWILYRVLRYDNVSQTMTQEREREAARYIEHSPVYDDGYEPRFH